MQNEDKFREIIHIISDPICIFNIKTMRFINVNKNFTNILDYTTEELTLSIFYQFCIRRRFRICSKSNNRPKQQRRNKRAEIRFISKCGEIKDLKWYFYFTSDAKLLIAL